MPGDKKSIGDGPGYVSFPLVSAMGDLFYLLYKAETGIDRVEKERMCKEVAKAFKDIARLSKDRAALHKAVHTTAAGLILLIGHRILDGSDDLQLAHSIYALKLLRNAEAFKKEALLMVKNASPRDIRID